MALPVASIAEPRSILFMWATSPKLPLALSVIEAWGFTFKSVAFVWVKTNKISHSHFTGMGFYTRQNAEFVLLATRGSPSLHRKNKSIHQIVEAPVSRHSEKPEEIRPGLTNCLMANVLNYLLAVEYRCGMLGALMPRLHMKIVIFVFYHNPYNGLPLHTATPPRVENKTGLS